MDDMNVDDNPHSLCAINTATLTQRSCLLHRVSGI